MRALIATEKLIEGGLLDHGPDLSRLLTQVMRALAQGRPVSREQVNQIITDLGNAPDEAHRFLREVTESDAHDAIVGIMGLSLNKTAHRLYVSGVQLSAWCAEDTLFLPALLDQTATVESESPVSGEKVRLVVSPREVESVSPTGAVVTIVIVEPDRADMRSVEAIWSTFCRHIYFFVSQKEAEQWIAGRDNIEILSVNEGFELGKLLSSRFLIHMS